ncbi:hypothetical protein KIMH_10390 [Bombiscardovia apis]|uniref:DUF58 domain-containing protein n=1 Tax=Bombiscardovia apis TaxID=2932182 RepID=A0ABN6SHE8_9BIFI|nr:DUF58 domain-containing protein [Bombiscardovia apis]BDR54928.1 hypothetical protein KIMH_10390 [Bombiscardovia apis]
MMFPASGHDPIRHKIEALSSQLSLPTVRKALGILEGEHPSGKRGSGYDYEGIRTYEAGDEARLIDWASSARMGRPMVAEHERLVTSKAWLFIDMGREMQATTASSESAAAVAANALRMFASLSLRRSDEVSLVTANKQAITRIPSQGGFAAFDQTLDKALDRSWSQPRNITAMLEYALRIPDRQSLIVIATDETAIGEQHLAAIKKIAQTHPLIVVSVATLNPLSPTNGFAHILDGVSKRQVPAFMRQEMAAQEVDTHRHYQNSALKRDLVRTGATLIHAHSSQSMFNEFVRILSAASLISTSGSSLMGGLR